nr:MAG TPA: hypothetical protein [Caudoviricetes sp.]
MVVGKQVEIRHRFLDTTLIAKPLYLGALLRG